MKTKLSIVAGFLLGTILLFFAFKNVPFANVVAIYKKVNPRFIVPFVITALCELALRGARWRLLLSPARPVRLWDTFRLEAAGLALSNILPLRLGEVIRGTFGSRILGIPMVTVFATILVERALDVLTLLAIFSVAACFGGVSGALVNYDKWMIVMCAGLFAGLGALIFSDELVAHRWFSGFFARFAPARSIFERLAMGVRGFHSFKSASLIIGFAFLQWSLSALNVYWVSCSFGLESVLGFSRSVALVVAGAAAASVPGMPGYFGNFEFVISKVTASWGIAMDVGFALALYMHVLGYIFITLLGVIFIYQMGHSLGRIWGDFSGRPGADLNA